MLENEITETKNKELMFVDTHILLGTQDAIDDIEDYTSKMFKIAQLINEDFFSHYQNERKENGPFDQNTMIGITHDFTGNNTLFEIIVDYLSKISDAAEAAGNSLRDIRQRDSEQKAAAI